MTPSVQPAAEDKRAAIVAAALKLFGRYGYRRTSIEDLAREAGIAKGTVYLYFKTKEDIFRALLQRVAEHFLAAADRALEEGGGAEERIRRILQAKFCYFHEILHGSPHASELIDSKNRISAELFTSADRAYLRVLTKAISEAAERGELALAPVGLSAEAAADLIIRSAHGVESSDASPVSPSVFRRRLENLARLFVTGLGGASCRHP